MSEAKDNRMEETQLQAAHRELQELYRRLGFVRPLSRDRIRLHMEIARVRKRIAALEREQRSPPA